MKKGRLKKRCMALGLACTMLFGTFTGTTASAGWFGNPEEEPETAVQYGLWMGDCWYEETEETGQWMMNIGNGDQACVPNEVSVKNMADYMELDLRAVDGTWNNACFFKYIAYTITDGENPSINTEEQQLITKAEGLQITYLGTELENEEGNEENTDPRWAIANVVDSSASITSVEGAEGFFKLQNMDPGYYIISNGELEIDEESQHFANSDAAVGLHVYEYTGLGVRDAYYDGESQQWIYDPDSDYSGEIWGRDLGDSAFAITDVVEGTGFDISIDELELTYYGEIGADPRQTYWKGAGETDEESGEPIEEEKYENKQDTKATIEVYQKDESLILFKPDKPGKYLISKKGISNDVTLENREIREKAILIDVDSNRAGFFESPEYSRGNLLFNEWANCYDTMYVGGQDALQFYYHAPLAEEGDAFVQMNVNYGEVFQEYAIEKDAIDSNDLSKVFSMNPVSEEEETGWYEITIKDLTDNMYIEFINSNDDNAYLNVSYYKDGQIELREVDREKTAYSFMEPYIMATTSFTMEAYGAEAGELKKITGENELSAFNVYEKFWIDEICWVEDDVEYFMDGFSRDENDELIYEGDPDDVRFIYDENTGEELQYVYKKVDSKNASIKAIEDGLEVQVNAIGDYLVTSEAGGWYEFRADLLSIGVYNTPERKEYNRDYIDNLEKDIKVYQGRDCSDKTYYVLAWVDKDHYDENGEPITDKDEVGNPIINETEDWKYLSQWTTDPDTIEIQAGEDVNFESPEDVAFTPIDGFVSVDEENPVIYKDDEHLAKIGYPITLTSAIEKDFSIIMSAKRIGYTLYGNDELSKDRYDALAVDYVPIIKLQVKTAPTKVEYIEGATFDPSGLVVEAVYEDGESFTLSKDEYKLAVSDKLSTNDKAVTISYLGKTVQLPITVTKKADFDLSKAAWNYKEAFTYDGTQKKVEITGLPEGLTVSYSGNTATEAGDYTAKATFSYDQSKYNAPDTTKLATLAWSIAKPADVTTDETAKPAAAGTEIKDTTTKAEYTVTETSGDTPVVAYEGTTDKKAKTVTVPATVEVNGVKYEVTEIADNAFKNNKTVTKITIGKNVTKVGKNAFSGCKNLKTVSVGNNVTTIEANAFKGCASLKTVTLPAKTTTIKASAFNGCKKLKTITIKSTKLTSKSVAKGAFKGLGKGTTIKVPKKKFAAYKKLFKQKGLSSNVNLSKY